MSFMVKRQSAVDFFQEEIIKIVNGDSKLSEIEIYNQAKEMEKQQIIDAYKIGYDEGLQIITKYENVEDYYISTYK